MKELSVHFLPRCPRVRRPQRQWQQQGSTLKKQCYSTINFYIFPLFLAIILTFGGDLADGGSLFDVGGIDGKLDTLSGHVGRLDGALVSNCTLNLNGDTYDLRAMAGIYETIVGHGGSSSSRSSNGGGGDRGADRFRLSFCLKNPPLCDGQSDVAVCHTKTIGSATGFRFGLESSAGKAGKAPMPTPTSALYANVTAVRYNNAVIVPYLSGAYTRLDDEINALGAAVKAVTSQLDDTKAAAEVNQALAKVYGFVGKVTPVTFVKLTCASDMPLKAEPRVGKVSMRATAADVGPDLYNKVVVDNNNNNNNNNSDNAHTVAHLIELEHLCFCPNAKCPPPNVLGTERCQVRWQNYLLANVPALIVIAIITLIGEWPKDGWPRPTLPAPLPLSFATSRKSRFATVAICAGMTSVLLQQLSDLLTVTSETDANSGPLSLPLGILMTVLLSGLFYPVAICVNATNELLGSALGLIYTGLAASVYADAVLCEIEGHHIYPEVTVMIPTLTSLGCLLLYFFYTLVCRIAKIANIVLRYAWHHDYNNGSNSIHGARGEGSSGLLSYGVGAVGVGANGATGATGSRSYLNSKCKWLGGRWRSRGRTDYETVPNNSDTVELVFDDDSLFSSNISTARTNSTFSSFSSSPSSSKAVATKGDSDTAATTIPTSDNNTSKSWSSPPLSLKRQIIRAMHREPQKIASTHHWMRVAQLTKGQTRVRAEASAAAELRAFQRETDGALRGCVRALVRRLSGFVRRNIYLSHPHFRYSPRMLSVLVVCLLLQAELFFLWTRKTVDVANFIRQLMDTGHCHPATMAASLASAYRPGNTTSTLVRTLINAVPGLTLELNFGLACEVDAIVHTAVFWSFLGSGLVGAILTTAAILRTAAMHRRALQRLAAGDRNFLPSNLSSYKPRQAIVDALKYSGFQIAYMLVGWGVVTVTLCVICVFIAFSIVLPLLGIYDDWFFGPILMAHHAKPLAISAAFYLLQVLLAALVFAPRGGGPGVRWRRVFQNVDFFAVATNVFVGVYSSVLRISLSLSATLCCLARLDVALLPRGLELRDPGFRTYVGALLLDAYYNNAILLASCQMLSDAACNVQRTRVAFIREALGLPADAKIEIDRISRTVVVTRSDKKETTMGRSVQNLGGVAGTSTSNVRLCSAEEVEAGTATVSVLDIFQAADIEYSAQLLSRRRRNRWALLVTLLNNPRLRSLRKYSVRRAAFFSNVDQRTLESATWRMERRLVDQAVLDAALRGGQNDYCSGGNCKTKTKTKTKEEEEEEEEEEEKIIVPRVSTIGANDFVDYWPALRHDDVGGDGKQESENVLNAAYSDSISTPGNPVIAKGSTPNATLTSPMLTMLSASPSLQPPPGPTAATPTTARLDGNMFQPTSSRQNLATLVQVHREREASPPQSPHIRRRAPVTFVLGHSRGPSLTNAVELLDLEPRHERSGGRDGASSGGGIRGHCRQSSWQEVTTQVYCPPGTGQFVHRTTTTTTTMAPLSSAVVAKGHLR